MTRRNVTVENVEAEEQLMSGKVAFIDFNIIYYIVLICKSKCI